MTRRIIATIATLLVTAIAVHAQGARTTDPGFLARRFSPVSYLKTSPPKPDARLGFGSALTGRTLVLSRDGNTLAVAAPEENNGTGAEIGRAHV